MVTSSGFFAGAIRISPPQLDYWIPIPVSDAAQMLEAKKRLSLRIERFSISGWFENIGNGFLRAELYLMDLRGSPRLLKRLSLGPGDRDELAIDLDPTLFVPGIQFLYLVLLRGSQQTLLRVVLWAEVVWSGAS